MIRKIALTVAVFILFLGSGMIQCQEGVRAHIDQLHKTQNFQYKTNLNVIEILKRAFPTFYDHIKRAGYAAPLEAAQNITIFAPTDEAFAFLKSDEMLGSETYDTIFNDVSNAKGMQRLRNVLNLHIIPGRVLANELMHREFVQPYVGRKLPIHIINGKMHINGSATAISTDIIGTNGVVHALNAVIM